MAFKGTLKEFKVPDILQLISLQKKTGILTFTSNDGFITLIFEEGAIVGVDSFPKKLEMRVGNVLVKQDYISEEMLQRALAIQKRTNQKIGEILLGMGLIGDQTISDSLKTQAVEIALSLFKWKKGEYNFKVMEHLDRSMKIIDPIATDNLIMEGVQMLDEWPHIMKLISNDSLIFEPIQVETQNIEIIDEYDDESISAKNDKVYLTETEANLLKYINGQNTVLDLVEMGIFTEYKVYKCLYNLINKSIIKIKSKVETETASLDRMADDVKQLTDASINQFFLILLILLLLTFILTVFYPLFPLKPENVLEKSTLYKEIVNAPEAGNPAAEPPKPTK